MCAYPGLKSYSGDCPYPRRPHPCSGKVLPLSAGFLWLSTLASEASMNPHFQGASLHWWQWVNTLAPSFHIWAYSKPSVRVCLWYQVWLPTVVTALIKPPSLTSHCTHNSASWDLPNQRLVLESLSQSVLLGEIQMKINVNYSCTYIS